MYKAIVGYLSGQEEGASPSAGSSHIWRQKLSRLLESYPHLAGEEEGEEEDSQEAMKNLCENAPEDLDFSLSSSDGEEEDEEGVGVERDVVNPGRTTRSMAVQRKPKVSVWMF